MQIRKTPWIALLPCLLVASLAWALTEQQVTDHAELIVSDLEALELSVEACPGGACAGSSAIEAELDSLGAELGDLQGERGALGGCGCQELDSVIDDAKTLNMDLRATVGGWEET